VVPAGWRTRVLLATGAAYALAAASTSAFTLPAEVMTGLPIAALAVLVATRWPLRNPPSKLAVPDRRTHPYRAWGALLAVLVAWELAQYLAPGARDAHPTVSSMADALDRHYALKALVFFGWLTLGALISLKGAQTDASSSTLSETP
jgi:hypothetical protein